MKRVVESELRVRYAETDAQGVVYYANYLVWFEVGRVNLLRALGIDYRTLEQTGLGFVIAEATCRYLAPARFDDEIVIRTWIEQVRRSSLNIAYAVLNRDTGKRLAEGSTAMVCVDLSGEPRSAAIPSELQRVLSAASQGGSE